MRKIITLRIIAIINILIFLYAIFAKKILAIEVQEIWFFLALILIAIPFLVKSYLFNVDASAYLGSQLLFCGIMGGLSKVFMLHFSVVYPWYIFSFAFASFIVFVFFRQNIHFKIFAIITVEVLILLMYKLNFLNYLAFWIVNGIYLAYVLVILGVLVVLSNRRT